MNEVQQRSVVTSLIVSGTPLTAVGAFVSIRALQTMDDFALTGLGLLIFLNGGSALLFLLGNLAELHLQSLKSLQCMKDLHRTVRLSLKERKYLKRLVKSCSLIKAGFGSNNFVESLTPLNCIDFANCLTVQLLLLSKT